MKNLSLIPITAALITICSCSFVERNTIGLFAGDSKKVEQVPFASSSSPQAEVERPQEAASASNASTQKLHDGNTAKVNVANLPNKPLSKLENDNSDSQVEVIWAIPQEPVEGFNIHYGYTRDNLNKTVKVNAKQLMRYEDPKYGFVYRHLIKNLEESKSIYVSLSAYNGDKESEASSIFEVTVNKK